MRQLLRQLPSMQHRVASLVLKRERRFATPRPVVGVVNERLDEHSRPPWHCDLLPATLPHFSYLRTWHLL